MIWFASLDPSNFSLNIDTSSINGGTPDDHLTIESVINCAFGEIDEFRHNLNKISSPRKKIRCAYLASIIWHEQRHFVDLILLNYGNYVFRQFALCYANMPFIMNEIYTKNKELALPLSIYTDPVRRYQLGQSELSATVQSLIKDLNEREKAIASDRKQIGYGVKEIGAYAHLEALGGVFQIAAVENIIPEYTAPLAEIVCKSDPSHKYDWYLHFRSVFKFPVLKNKVGYETARIGLFPIILYATLSTRSWARDNPDTYNHRPNRTFLKAAERFEVIIQYLSKQPPIFEPFDFDSVWGKVNSITKQLFGRTIIEEIEVDIQFHENNLVNNILKNKGDQNTTSILLDHLSVRKKLFSLLKEDPKKILCPDTYSRNTLSKIAPVPVLTLPSGADSEMFKNSRWEGLNAGVFEERNGKTSKHYWNAIPNTWTLVGKIGFKKNEAWRELFRFVTPLAKAMLKGRNYRTSLGPEFFVMEEELKLLGIRTLYEPEFEFPQNLSVPAASFYEMRDKEEAVCDLCGLVIKRPNGFILSPWVFRQSSQLKNFGVKLLGDNKEAVRKMEVDWSAWLFCNDCHNKFVEAGWV